MRRILLLLFLLIGCSAGRADARQPVQDALDWRQLPALPVALSGTFAGVSNGALIVAGGAHFPEGSPFEGGQKRWVDTLFVLEPGDEAWRTGFNVGRPLAYGASVTTEDGVIFIGGGNGEQNYADVFRLRYTAGRIEKAPLPNLPRPCAMTSAALVEGTIYVAGGQASPDASTAMKNFWALDLSADTLRWQVLEPWPGPARILPVAVAQDGAFYLISGAELTASATGGVTRRYLTDAHRYQPREGWTRIADVPRPVVAAPAVSYGSSHLLIFGGDDGRLADRAEELRDHHPGFSRDVLAYDTSTGSWAVSGALPAGLVTTNAVRWEGGIVIPGGEDRPGHRSSGVYQARMNRSSASFAVADYAVLSVYLLILVGMGLYFSRREASTNDFFLAGRRIPWWAAGLSIFGTQLSAITFMAIPAKAYATDWVFFLVNMTIVLVAPIIVYFYLPFFQRLNITTAYAYLEKRFNLAVRWFGSIAFILFQLGRMGIVVALPAIALATVTGVDVTLCILVIGLFSMVYTTLGGIEADIWSDVLHVVVLLGGALLSLVLIATELDGGFAQILSVGAAESKFHMFNWTWDFTTTAVWVVVVGNFLGNLVPYTTDQSVIQRYLTTRDEGEARSAIWTNALLTIPASVLFFGVGTALYVFYQAQPDLLTAFEQQRLTTDTIFPYFISQQLPAGVSGLVIAGLFAAAMSTLDSSMNSIATALVTDFYYRLKPEADDRGALRLARYITVAVGAIGTATALVIATYEVASLWDLFLKIVGLFGGSVAGIFALGIFTRRTNGRGALAGAIVSALVLLLVQRFTEVHFFLYAGIGILSCVLVGYVASLLVPAAEKRLDGLTLYTMDARYEDEAVNEAPAVTEVHP